MFTLVLREDEDNHCAGIVILTQTSDGGIPLDLCRAEAADDGNNTGTCTVSTSAQIYAVAVQDSLFLTSAIFCGKLPPVRCKG